VASPEKLPQRGSYGVIWGVKITLQRKRPQAGARTQNLLSFPELRWRKLEKAP